MRCTICEAESDVGEDYEFYYGTKLGTTYWAAGIRYGSTTLYNIAGRENGFLCLECMRRYVLKSWMTARLIVNVVMGSAIFAILLTLLVALFTDRSPNTVAPLSLMLALLLVVGALGYLLISLRLEKVREGDKSAVMNQMRSLTPDGLAIEMRKADPKRAGYDAFFTPEGYRMLVDENIRLWH
jgi:hypothetical protein